MFQQPGPSLDIKIHLHLIGRGPHRMCNIALTAERAIPSCASPTLCWHTSAAWMYPQRTSPPFCSPPHRSFPFSFSSLRFIFLLLRLPSPTPRQICGVRSLSLFCESCEGNLEGLSGINLKGKCSSLPPLLGPLG